MPAKRAHDDTVCRRTAERAYRAISGLLLLPCDNDDDNGGGEKSPKQAAEEELAS